MSWKKWVGIGLIAAAVIAILVLHLVQPEVTYAFAEVMSAITFVGGGVAGYLIAKYLDERK